MKKIAAWSRKARESLSHGLAALQEGDAPERLLIVAEPLAQALGMLIEMEVATPTRARKAAEHVLRVLRETLGLLQQPENLDLPAAERALGHVAEALSLVREIEQSSGSAERDLAPTPLGLRGSTGGAPRVSPSAQDTGKSALGLPAVDAALGAHSATNFYKGLLGGDVIASGGLFVATYQVPEVGQTLRLTVSLPGGYAFEAMGVVAWTREVQPAATAGASPGFGVRLREVSDEGRGLIQRYVRNREPLFHDDA